MFHAVGSGESSRHGGVRNGVTAGLAKRVYSRGSTIEAAFEDAAKQLFSLDADRPAAGAHRTLPVSFVHYSDDGSALETWLKLLLRLAEEHALTLSEVHVRRRGAYWWGYAKGASAGKPVLPHVLSDHPAEVRRAEADWTAAFSMTGTTRPGAGDPAGLAFGLSRVP